MLALLSAAADKGQDQPSLTTLASSRANAPSSAPPGPALPCCSAEVDPSLLYLHQVVRLGVTYSSMCEGYLKYFTMVKLLVFSY